MDHKQLISHLSADQRRALLEKRDGPGLIRLTVLLLAIILLALLVKLSWLAMLPLGVLLSSTFTLMHEAIHRTAFKTKALNDTVAWFCGVILFLPPEWFRLFHFAHHRHTQDPDLDPELAGGGKPKTWAAYAWHVSGLPIWIASAKTLWANASGRFDYSYVPPSKRPTLMVEARIVIAVYLIFLSVSLAVGSTALIWLWLLPILIGQPVLRLYLLAEHGRCPQVANMLANSRTTFTNRVVKWLAWNMPYHAEHHAYPAVPFHNLPEWHQITQSHLMATSKGYGAFTREFTETLNSNHPSSGSG